MIAGEDEIKLRRQMGGKRQCHCRSCSCCCYTGCVHPPSSTCALFVLASNCSEWLISVLYGCSLPDARAKPRWAEPCSNWSCGCKRWGYVFFLCAYLPDDT